MDQFDHSEVERRYATGAFLLNHRGLKPTATVVPALRASAFLRALRSSVVLIVRHGTKGIRPPALPIRIGRPGTERFLSPISLAFSIYSFRRK